MKVVRVCFHRVNADSPVKVNVYEAGKKRRALEVKRLCGVCACVCVSFKDACDASIFDEQARAFGYPIWPDYARISQQKLRFSHLAFSPVDI
jgi:hypothetical protein